MREAGVARNMIGHGLTINHPAERLK